MVDPGLESTRPAPLDPLEPEPATLAPGVVLDRYELLCPIGRGGMGSVWVARLRGKHGFEKLVAIKTIVAGRSHDDRFRRMFLDEARIASRIDHVNVARILDLGEQEGLLYLTMEWVNGDSLTSLLRAVRKSGAHVAPGVALRAVADACRGLHAAHNLRDGEGAHLEVVHRDVSPQNILMNAEGIAKRRTSLPWSERSRDVRLPDLRPAAAAASGAHPPTGGGGGPQRPASR